MNSARQIISILQIALAATFVLACETPQAPTAPPPIEEFVDDSGFSTERAWRHLAVLAGSGPRVSGTDGAKRAHDYITSELQRMGVDIAETPEALPTGFALKEGEAEPNNIVAEIPGASDDLIVLVAPYDSRQFENFDFLGANDGASGAALLLEFAEVLSQRPLSYTTWLVFLDAEAPRVDAADHEILSQLNGSRLQAARFKEADVLPRVRLLVGFNRVCDPDLAITRDLGSHRNYREDFWNAAARLGHDDIFQSGQPFETVLGSHRPFAVAGARRVVFISDSTFGGEEPPGFYADTADDDLAHCSSNSLQVVGGVSLEALRTISKRLAKIDRFSTSPLASLPSEEKEEEEFTLFDEEPVFDAPVASPESAAEEGAAESVDLPPADSSEP